jgi:hypothetical protein
VAQPDGRAVGQIQQYLDELDGYVKKHGYIPRTSCSSLVT